MSDVGAIVRAKGHCQNLPQAEWPSVYHQWEHEWASTADAFAALLRATPIQTETYDGATQTSEGVSSVQSFEQLIKRPKVAAYSISQLTSFAKDVARENGARPGWRQMRAFKRRVKTLVKLSKRLARKAEELTKHRGNSQGLAASSAGPPATGVTVSIQRSLSATPSSTRSDMHTMSQNDTTPVPTSTVASTAGQGFFFKALGERCAGVVQRLQVARQTRDTALKQAQSASSQYQLALPHLQEMIDQYSDAMRQLEQLQAQLDASEREVSDIRDHLKRATDSYVSVERYNAMVERDTQWQQAVRAYENDLATAKREQGERDAKLANSLILVLDSVAPLTMQNGKAGKHEHVEALEQTITNHIHKILADTWNIRPVKIEPHTQYVKGYMEIEARVDDRDGKYRGCVAQVRQRGYIVKDSNGDTVFRPARVTVYQ